MLQTSGTPNRAGLTVVDHPLVQHKLSLMRDRNTSTAEFRRLLREISLLLAYEATRDLALESAQIETPLERGSFPLLSGKKLCLVSILRAGNGILDGMLDLLPSARVGHIGIYREPRTLQAVEYYLKLPEDLSERDVILVDPMVATGNSAVAAISRLVELKARSIKFVCLVAAPEDEPLAGSSFILIQLCQSEPLALVRATRDYSCSACFRRSQARHLRLAQPDHASHKMFRSPP